jgi:hypothetical protein
LKTYVEWKATGFSQQTLKYHPRGRSFKRLLDVRESENIVWPIRRWERVWQRGSASWDPNWRITQWLWCRPCCRILLWPCLEVRSIQRRFSLGKLFPPVSLQRLITINYKKSLGVAGHEDIWYSVWHQKCLSVLPAVHPTNTALLITGLIHCYSNLKLFTLNEAAWRRHTLKRLYLVWCFLGLVLNRCYSTIINLLQGAITHKIHMKLSESYTIHFHLVCRFSHCLFILGNLTGRPSVSYLCK